MAQDALTVLEFVPVPEPAFPPGWREALEAAGCTLARREGPAGRVDYLVIRGAARLRFRVFVERSERQSLLSAGFLTRQLLWLLEREGLVRVVRGGRSRGVPPAPGDEAAGRPVRRRIGEAGRMMA